MEKWFSAFIYLIISFVSDCVINVDLQPAAGDILDLSIKLKRNLALSKVIKQPSTSTLKAQK